MSAGHQNFGCRAFTKTGANRETITQTFSQSHDIRHNITMLTGKPFSSTADARLYFIQYHQIAFFIAKGTNIFKITGGGSNEPTFTLYGFHHNSNDVVITISGFFYRIHIIKINMDKAGNQWFKAGLNLGVSSGGQS